MSTPYVVLIKLIRALDILSCYTNKHSLTKKWFVIFIEFEKNCCVHVIQTRKYIYDICG